MRAFLAALAASVLFAGAAEARDAFPGPAHAGTGHYRYQSIERTAGQPGKRYRVDYDLVVARDHSVVAIIRGASEAEGETWTDVTVDPACAAAMHARGRELARVTLWPISPEAASTLGAEFLAECAPAAIFYPITDILNVALVQASPQFALATLHAAGEHARTPAYAVHFDRLGVAIVLGAEGGETAITTLEPRQAVVEWTSDPMQLSIARHSASGDLTLTGVEHYAFRLEIDRRSGRLLRAGTTSDQLDLVVALPNVPADGLPRVTVTREVTIEPR